MAKAKKENKEIRYPERTCIECIRYQCFKGQDKFSDFAKYGCIKYEKKV